MVQGMNSALRCGLRHRREALNEVMCSGCALALLMIAFTLSPSAAAGSGAPKCVRVTEFLLRHFTDVAAWLSLCRTVSSRNIALIEAIIALPAVALCAPLHRLSSLFMK
jgi:hypothetical protein